MQWCWLGWESAYKFLGLLRQADRSQSIRERTLLSNCGFGVDFRDALVVFEVGCSWEAMTELGQSVKIFS